MNILKHLLKASAVSSLVIGICAIGIAETQAALVISYPGTDFSLTPYVISFGGGAATYTFTPVVDISDPLTVDAVSTGGVGLVDSFLGVPAPYQLGTFISDADTFLPFPEPANILYSLAEDSIGLAFQLPDGVHYGYVTMQGQEILQYGYDSTPNEGIYTGSDAPEPATWVMLIIGLGVLGTLGRRQRHGVA